MSAEIRHVRAEEFESFAGFLERAFGHSKAFFQREYPHLYQPTQRALEWAYVIEEDGEIASHVGLYPIETVTAGVRISVGGIGAVSTVPSARGRGYMTELLRHIIGEMRRIGYPVSWLGGDRQRYNSFGWEMAAPVYRLSFSQRSLGWQDVKPVEIDEVLPEAALDTIQRFQSVPDCHAVRPDLTQQIQKIDLRFWIADDGYAILRGQGRTHLDIVELVSASGDEAGMIRAMLDWNFGEKASWTLSVWDVARLARLMPVASGWTAGNSGMYRINDLTQLLTLARPILETRAAAMKDVALALGIKEYDRTKVTTLQVEDGHVTITPGRQAETYVEINPVEAARLILGGPPTLGQARIPPALLALLPVPCYVLPLDHV